METTRVSELIPNILDHITGVGTAGLFYLGLIAGSGRESRRS
jgi:hypothetical protein